MAQLRPEVRPDVTSMPVDGFVMQTGGSARRRVVQFDESMNSYKVTGVPGHTHNTSAVCSVLVDNTERSNVPFTISNDFANQAVVHTAPRYTDSAAVDESEYDRAIERGIGEIAIIPENCHQEIREPVRDIYELRTLVTPKDKLDTLTYVEEVGGFVDQATGEVPVDSNNQVAEPTYPDVQIDLFHDHPAPVAVANVVAHQAGVHEGTGNHQDLAHELRFTSDWSSGNFSRNNTGVGSGTAFAVLVRPFPDDTYATKDGAAWDGVVTMSWDANRKLYSCPSFEVIFDRVLETKTFAGSVSQQTHSDFEVQFPELTTDVSTDGQCLFATGDRPLGDGGLPKTIECTVNQASLSAGITDSILKFGVFPFRIATGYDSVIYGKGKTESYFARVRNTTESLKMQHVKEIPNAVGLWHNAGGATHELLELQVRNELVGNTNRASSEMPLISNRNEVPGTSWNGLPNTIDNANLAFGWCYGSNGTTTSEAFNTRPFNTIAGLTPAVRALMVAEPIQPAAAGWQAAANALPENMRKRVRRVFQPQNLMIQERLPDAYDEDDEKAGTPFVQFQQYLKSEEDDDRLTLSENVYMIEITTTPLVGNATVANVPYQSNEHYDLVTTKLGIEVQRQQAIVTAIQAVIDQHNANIVHVKAGTTLDVFSDTTGDVQVDYPAGYNFQGADNIDAKVIKISGQIDISENTKRTVMAEHVLAQTHVSNHRNGIGFLFGTKVSDDVATLFPVENPELSLELALTAVNNAAVGAVTDTHMVMIPSTIRFLFRNRSMAWVHRGDDDADQRHLGNSEFGLQVDDLQTKGNYQQQETAMFQVWTDMSEHEVDGGTTTLKLSMNMQSLFDIQQVHQDRAELADQQWRPTGENNDVPNPQTQNALRNTVAGKQILVMSVGPRDDVQEKELARLTAAADDATGDSAEEAQYTTALSNLETASVNKFTDWLHAFTYGNVGVIEVVEDATDLFAQLVNKNVAYQRGLGNLATNLDRSALVQNRRVKMIPKRIISIYNELNGELDEEDDIIYLVDVHINFDKNRQLSLVMNDRGTNAVPKKPTTLLFDSDNCTPMLFWDETYNFANLVTKVTGVREMRLGTTAAERVAETGTYAFGLADTFTWAMARADDAAPNAAYSAGLLARIGNTPNGSRDKNRAWATLYQAPLKFQDLYWNEAPFKQRIADSEVRGVVHRSRLRVSQHLCAPLLNPNRRIGCSAPLNYDSMHLPPELRDFRIVLHDRDFSFLPGSTETATLEPLVLYEFNGGTQDPGVKDSLLYMPHFRTFSTTTTDQTFELEVFSPYGNPSYLALFARSKVRPTEYVKQPLIKTLSISSGTTMKKSNTILEAREHELFHLTQRNVHPRAEYNRHTNQKRQVVLLCAEDIGDMGIARYQKEKRANFVFRGTLDVPAKVTALFIYNNRGLSIHSREIGVVRV